MIFYITKLLLLSLNLPVEWLTAKSNVIGVGIMSQYRPGIKSPTVPYARYPGRWNVKPTSADLVCAHRSIAFGTILRLRSGKAVGYCTVLDRGPFGFCEKQPHKRKISKQCPQGYRYVVNVRKRKHGWYRGVLDATPAVHKLLGSTGWIRVSVERLKIVKSRRIIRVKKSGRL